MDVKFTFTLPNCLFLVYRNNRDRKDPDMSCVSIPDKEFPFPKTLTVCMRFYKRISHNYVIPIDGIKLSKKLRIVCADIGSAVVFSLAN